MTELITINDVEGSHQELIKTNTTPQRLVKGRRVQMPLIHQHITPVDDINKAQPTVFYPPYQHRPDDLNLIQGTNKTPGSIDTNA